eukprot:m.167301 g.167301  ORF g.167301 m.167301 type:complete len:354 (-) comp14457_c0_seq4:154-1215(-)
MAKADKTKQAAKPKAVSSAVPDEEDLSEYYLGVFQYPLAALLFAIGVWVVFFPSPEVGKYVLPVLIQMAQSCQDIVDATGLVPASMRPDKEITVWSAIPLSIFMFFGILIGQTTITRLVSKYAGEEATKFGECMGRVLYYGPMFFVALAVIDLEDIWPNLDNCWVKTGVIPQTIEVQAYYVFEMSYYIGGIFVHIFLDERLSDFYIMLLHHGATVALIMYSYMEHFHRIGLLVLMVHDVSDIFLDSAKCFHYVKIEILSTVTFVNLIVSWILYRLYFYPFYILENVFVSALEIIENPPKSWTFYRILLGFLQILHIYWFYLILKVAQNAVFAGGLRDVRDSGDGETSETKKKD